jgi:hypothetical protein
MAFIEHPDKYFGLDQVPEGFKLLDLSKMKDPQIKEILTFWYSKQEANGFRFNIGTSSYMEENNPKNISILMPILILMPKHSATQGSGGVRARGKVKGKAKW